MQTTYSADIEQIDQPIEDADAARKPGESIRIRVQPSIFNRAKVQHRSWPGVSWTLDCQSPREAIALREALRAFFEACGKAGPAKVRTLLEDHDFGS